MNCPGRQPCRSVFPFQRPTRDSVHQRGGQGRRRGPGVLFTGGFIGVGSEFVDHREQRVESSEDAAWAGGGHGLARLPRSLAPQVGALVPVPWWPCQRVPRCPGFTEPPSGCPPGLATVHLSVQTPEASPPRQLPPTWQLLLGLPKEPVQGVNNVGFWQCGLLAAAAGSDVLQGWGRGALLAGLAQLVGWPGPAQGCGLVQ